MKRAEIRGRVRKMLRGEAGFSLLEGMAASVVLAIGILAMAGMQDIVIRSNSRSDDITTAANLAETKADELRGISFIQSEVNSGIYNRTNSSQSAVADKLDEINEGPHPDDSTCTRINDQGESDANGNFCISWTITERTSTFACEAGNCENCSGTAAGSGFCSRQADITVYYGKPFLAGRRVTISTQIFIMAPDKSIKAVS